jgi:hypothetical protein
MQFKEIIAVYDDNHAKHIHIKYSVSVCQRRWYTLCNKNQAVEML